MKIYETPQIHIVPLRGPMLMLQGSQKVNDYNRGNDITIGDED